VPSVPLSASDPVEAFMHHGPARSKTRLTIPVGRQDPFERLP
jgi:hypothetical protein